jgi:hypothetical protein
MAPLGIAGPARAAPLGIAGTARAAQLHARPGLAVMPLPTGQLPPTGDGRPLAPVLRQTLERVFQTDLTAVRVHQGPAAGAIGARAFTVGDHIHFAPGAFDPSSREGLALLGHELSHVVQQRAGRVANPYRRGIAVVQDPALEAEAERMARRVADTVGLGLRIAQPQLAPRAIPGRAIPGRAIPNRAVPGRAIPGALQRMEAPKLPGGLTIDTGEHTEADRAAVLAIFSDPFYAGIIRALIQHQTPGSFMLRPLTIRSTGPGDITNRALWDGRAKQIRLRPDVEGAARRELIKWELINGSRQFDASGITAQTGPNEYANQIEQFEYETAKLYAAHWQEGDAIVFGWTLSLKQALLDGTPMSPEQWVTSIRRTPDSHYQNAQHRYLIEHGTTYLQSTAGAQWLASREGEWFLETATWRGIQGDPRRVIEHGLARERGELDQSRSALEDDIARRLAAARAKRTQGSGAQIERPGPGGGSGLGLGGAIRRSFPSTRTSRDRSRDRGDDRRRDSSSERSRSRSPTPVRRPRLRSLVVYYRDSDSYRGRFVIEYIYRVYSDGSRRRDTVDHDGNRLWRYFYDAPTIRAAVARIYNMPVRAIETRYR